MSVRTVDASFADCGEWAAGFDMKRRAIYEIMAHKAKFAPITAKAHSAEARDPANTSPAPDATARSRRAFHIVSIVILPMLFCVQDRKYIIISPALAQCDNVNSKY
jgi:hypothetical protein